MCIIVFKPKGKDLPKTLEDCWTNNPDGAGYCMKKPNKDEIIIKKGFMKWKDFENSINNIKNPRDIDILFHFRIATSGGVNKEFCHPFPLSDNIEKLTASRTTTKMAICHNGIISGFGDKDVSDTAEYIANVAYPLFRATRLEQSEYTDEIIKNTVDGSRIATMTSHGVRLIGDWEENDGIYYSNSNYLPYYRYSYYGYGKSYDYDDDYYYGMYSDYFKNNKKTSKPDEYRERCIQKLWLLPEDEVVYSLGDELYYNVEELEDAYGEVLAIDNEGSIYSYNNDGLFVLTDFIPYEENIDLTKFSYVGMSEVCL